LADVAVVGDNGGSVSAKLRGINKALSGSLVVTGTFWQGTQPVSISSHVTVDQGTAGVSKWLITADPITFASAQHVIVDTAPSTAVTNIGVFAVQAALNAETTKVIGTVNQGTSPWVVTGSGGTFPVTGTVSINAIPAGANVIGHVIVDSGAVAATGPTLTKGTQGSTGYAVQDLKDSGRTSILLFLDAVAGITTEALATMQINKGGVAQTAATSYTVTAGKTLRISGMHTSVKNTSTVASDSRTRVRQAASSFSVSSPIHPLE